jgi:phospholipid/cholesterol/gamma-HCH transport system substrate-binding protein
MREERSIELKVGLLVLASLTILVVFVFAMGGINLEKTYTIYVDFRNPGWISSGAQVKVSGVLAGKVEDVTFMGGEMDEKAGHRVYVRLELAVRKKFQEAIHDDAEFYISSQGVLGEQYVEIDPGSPHRPYLEDGAVVQGVSPPRLELALSKGYVVIDTLNDVLTENREEIDGIFTHLNGILAVTDETLERNEGELDDIIKNVHDMSAEGSELVGGARAKYVDNPRIDRILGNVESITHKVDEDIGPVMTSARSTLEQTDQVMGQLGSEEQEKVKRTISHLESSARKTDEVLTKVDSIVTFVEEGEGTIGAFLKDEELYDDLAELVRDLKHNPWKLIWKD